MNRRLYQGLALAAAGALALTACGGGSSGKTPAGGTSQSTETTNAVKGGTLNMLGSGDVDYMDPNISYYSIGYLAARMWTRQLYQYPADPKNNTKGEPDLATGAPDVSSDGLTVKITIQKGAKWDTNPARQITAEDMVRGVLRTCNPAQPFGGLPDYEDLIAGFKNFCDGFSKVGQSAKAIADYINQNIDKVSGVSVDPSNDRTVVFKLTHPAAYFPDMLTMTAFTPAPKEVLDYVPGSSELAQHQIASGPYKIESYDPTKKIVFVRNPAWDGKTDKIRKAYVDKIVIDETVSQESTQQQLETGTPSADMEFDNFPPPSALPRLLSGNDPNFNLGPTASSNPYVVFNFVSPNNGSAMGKQAFREGLEYCINRDNIIQALGGPKVNPPLTHVLPNTIVGGEEDFNLYPYDVNKGKAKLQEAGAAGVTLKFLYRNASEGSRKTFATVQQDLQKCGLKVEGVPVPNADFYTKYLEVPDVAKRGVWDLSLAGWGTDWYGNGAVSWFLPLFAGKSAFPPNGSDFGFYPGNDKIQAGVDAKNESEARKAWHDADMQVMKDAAFFPITQPNQPNYHAKQVHNAVYIPSIQNFDPTNVWLEQGMQGG